MNLSPLLQSVQDFLAQPTFSFTLQATVGYIALLWIFAILWVAKDSGNRSESILFQLIAILLIVIATPLIGLPLYLLIRPSQTLCEQDLYEMLQFLVEEESEEEIEKHPKKREKPKRQRKPKTRPYSEEGEDGEE